MALYERSVSPEATRLGGRIIDLRGDGVLAEFPDASAALTWARALHAASIAGVDAEPTHLPIVLRIAIHVGSALSSRHGLFGDAVNLTARLQEYGTPGGIVLSADAMAAVKDDLGASARDVGELPLRNMSRTVRAFVLEAPSGAVPVPLPPPPARLPSVAVLSLTNLTGDSADDYLAEGMVADIIASLAGLHEVFVIAQDSARVFRGHRPDPRRIGHMLGVRFVVTGQLRRAAVGMRVSIELLDSETGETLWGGRFEMTAKDILDVQDRVITEIVNGMVPNLHAAALRDAMRKRPENLTAYDLMLRGLHAMEAREPEGFGRALTHLERAIAEDPGFASPLAWAARWHSLNIGYGWSSNAAADNEEAMALAERAIALDRTNALALATHGHLTAYLRHDCDTAMESFRQALSACPNSALAWTLSSGTLSYIGAGAEAVRHAERGLRLSPYDPLRFSQQHFLSIAHYCNGNLSEAERWGRRCIGANPAHASCWRVLSAVLAALGRGAEAREAARRMLELEPGFRLDSYVADRMPMRDRSFRIVSRVTCAPLAYLPEQ